MLRYMIPTSNTLLDPPCNVMLLNVVTSDRVTLLGLLYIMLATQRMNFISKGFSSQNYSGSTSFSCLASAASLVAIFWFQLEKSAGDPAGSPPPYNEKDPYTMCEACLY